MCTRFGIPPGVHLDRSTHTHPRRNFRARSGRPCTFRLPRWPASRRHLRQGTADACSRRVGRAARQGGAHYALWEMGGAAEKRSEAPEVSNKPRPRPVPSKWLPSLSRRRPATSRRRARECLRANTRDAAGEPAERGGRAAPWEPPLGGRKGGWGGGDAATERTVREERQEKMCLREAGQRAST